MGLTYLSIDIANPARPEDFRTERFLIDSGAVYSVVQGPVLEDLGIEPHSRRTFTLANGDQIERGLGDALFRYKEHRGAAPVIFGEPGDSNLLGCGHPRGPGVRAGSPEAGAAPVEDAAVGLVRGRG